MPALKRSRAVQEDDGTDQDLDGDTSPRSPSQLDTRKRSKPSSDSRYDDESDSSIDTETEELQATQFNRKQKLKERDVKNVPADSGIIETVTCSNFMCHGYLQVDVGPLINFVIGHNGSGKSAVLTALTICLGGKASSTNRGGSLKAFIKEGQESCTLSVKLKNQGAAGYQQDVYGDSIIVERLFSRSGNSGFKLKSSSGRIISTKRGDLDEISDYFALQLDNPMSVLTQDMARQFLNSSSPAEKYKFFIKGVQLEQLHNDYLLLEDSIDSIEASFGGKLEALKLLEDRAARAKGLFELSEKTDEMVAKVKKLGIQMAWAQVEDQELYLKTYDEDLLKVDEDIKRTQVTAQNASDRFDEINIAHERAVACTAEIDKELPPLAEEKEKAQAELDAIKNEASHFQAQQRTISGNLKAAEARIAKAKKDIDEEYKRLEEANGGSHARRLGEIDKGKLDAAAAEKALESHGGSLKALEDNKRQAGNSLEKSKGLLRAKEEEIRLCREQVELLRRDRGRQRSGYPANMNQLINAIKEYRGFRENPIGPIGDYVRLLNPVWSSVLEKSFGATLNSFIVTSPPDQVRLSGIMQKVRCSVPILIGNNVEFDFSNNEPDPKFATILRVLEVGHPMVLRQMIINQAIEQTILIEEKSEAIDVMAGPRLRNVKQCFAVNKHTAGAGIRFTYGYKSNLASTYILPYQGVARMKTDIDQQINYQRQVLQDLENQYSVLEQDYRKLQAALENCNQEIGKHKKVEKNLRLASQRADELVESLQDALEKDAIEEGRLEALKNGLEEAEGEKQHLQNAYKDTVREKDTNLAKRNANLKGMDDIDKRTAEVDVRILKAKDRERKMSDRRMVALQEKNKLFQVVETAQANKLNLTTKRADKAQCVASFIQDAGKIGARLPIDEGDTPEILDKKLQKLNADLQRYQQRIGGDKRKIAEDYARANQAYTDALVQHKELEKLAQLLKATHTSRDFRWEQFRRYITARARLMFQYLLTERAFQGRMKVNHREKQLSLQVQPDKNQKNSSGKETGGLSGGEKSFSTICLLLSLWDAMGAPIRCLDEFDVFMDSVNRDISMRMLIKIARRSVGRQFIFITPQSMNSLTGNDDVKIIKMRDPDRTGQQTTLPFGATDLTQG